MGTLPGVNVEVGAPISHRIDAMLSGTRASIAVKIFGTDLNEMYRIGNRIKAAVEGVEGIADLNVEQQVERPQLKIVPKRDVMAKYGVTMPEFADMVSVLLAGCRRSTKVVACLILPSRWVTTVAPPPRIYVA